MTEAVFDFAAINRRLNRKPDLACYSPSAVNDTIRSKMAALRAEVEQMERDQDILGLRLLADERLINGGPK